MENKFEMCTFNFYFKNIYASPTDINIQLKCLPENIKQTYSDNGGLMQKLDLFKNVSVSQLFKVINNKIKNRGKK